MMSERIMQFKTIIILAGFMLLGACATSGPQYNAKTLQQAIDKGSLERFYAHLSREIVSGSTDENHQQLLIRSGEILAKNKVAQMRFEVENLRSSSGFIPLDKVQQLNSTPEILSTWGEQYAADYLSFIAEEKDKTERFLTLKLLAIKAINPNHPDKQLILMEEVFSLSGKESEFYEQVQGLQKDLLTLQYRLGLKSLDLLNFEEATKHLLWVKKLDKDYPNLTMRFAQIEAGKFNLKFNEMVESGNVDGAYSLLMSRVNQPEFEQIVKNVKPMAKLIADYFSSSSADAITNAEYLKAYEWLKKSKDVFLTLGINDSSHSDEENNFLETIFKLYQKASKEGKSELALGHLKIIEEFKPEYTALTKVMREAVSQVMLEAVKGVSISPFVDLGENSSVGSVISARVTRHLLDNINNDVRIVEREQLASVIREQELKQQVNSDNLATAHFFIEGTIDDSRVDFTTNQGKEKKRVIVGSSEVLNPTYIEWEKNRKKGVAPNKYIQKPIYEDVTLSLAHQKKVGFTTVSFRIIDAATAKVIFSNTLTETENYAGKSVEGLSIGVFVQENVFANLPSDIQILDSLTTRISQRIGLELAEFFKDQDNKYQILAQQYQNEGNLSLALEEYVHAYVIAAQKGKETVNTLQSLKTLSLNKEVLENQGF